ncbi:hypothetical protein ACIHFD_05485 [Nonomuraea sp. NPDC051941]|uniref:hypothetical protein n=1 Tax=Nonomuraea sp. NPDC051941 TaxID=3364373 RepID=UPI0037C5C819
MSLLEQRYRSVLRLLPASYRAEREEEMVDAFMEMSGEAPDEANPRPRWGEIASVLSLSLRVRLGGPGASPRFVAWGEAVRLVALLGLGHQAVGSVYQFLYWGHALAFGTEVAWTGSPGSVERLVSIAVSAADLCSAVAFVAIMRGHVRTAKVTAVIGVTAPLVYTLIPMILAGPLTDRPLSDPATLVFTAAPVIALLMGFHSDITPRRRSWAATLSPAAGGLAVAVRHLAGRRPATVQPGLALPVAGLRHDDPRMGGGRRGRPRPPELPVMGAGHDGHRAAPADGAAPPARQPSRGRLVDDGLRPVRGALGSVHRARLDGCAGPAGRLRDRTRDFQGRGKVDRMEMKRVP